MKEWRKENSQKPEKILVKSVGVVTDYAAALEQDYEEVAQATEEEDEEDM